MKMTKRKIFSIVMASIALFLFINMFIPQVDYGYYKVNMWDMEGMRVIFLFAVIAIITLYLLHLFLNLKDRWVRYANYATGFITLYYLAFFFGNMKGLYVGIILGLLASLGLATISVLWDFMSDKPLGHGAPIKGYDAKTGQPIYAKPKGFDPKTGKPIYEEE
ncbi:MAG: hypothetical protein IJ568_02575 [Bacilli bacterium]|nr:hypothetical protein [Bacilli bacterium]